MPQMGHHLMVWTKLWRSTSSPLSRPWGSPCRHLLLLFPSWLLAAPKFETGFREHVFISLFNLEMIWEIENMFAKTRDKKHQRRFKMKAATRRWAGLASRDLPFSRSPPPLFSSVPTYVVLLRSSSHASSPSSSLSSSFPARRLSCQAKTALLSSLCSFERGYVTVAGDLDKRTRAQLAWERERWHLRQVTCFAFPSARC